MYYIKHSLVLLAALIFVLPLAAQQSNTNVRVDTTHRIFRDIHGNIVGEHFGLELRMEGNVEARKDQLQNRKIAYFSSRIGLTAKEAERFWPIYNEYSDRKDKVKEEQRKVLRQLSNYERMNEKDVKTLLDAYVNSCVQESALFQEYHKKFSAILPPSKVVRLYLAEEEFKRMLLDIVRYGR